MNRTEDKPVDGSKCADCAGGYEYKRGVECVFMLVGRAGKANGGQRDDRGKPDHHETQTVNARGEAQSPLGRNHKRGNVLKIVLTLIKGRKEKQRRRKRQYRCG